MIPVSTRLWANLCVNEQDLRNKTLLENSHQGEIPTVEIEVPEDWSVTRNNHDISDVPISNVSVDLYFGIDPPPTLWEMWKIQIFIWICDLINDWRYEIMW